MYILIKLANLFECQSKALRRKVRNRKSNKFIKKYNLLEVEKTKKTNIKFNPYERTDFCLIDSLIESKNINKNDYILDIGCGAGLFLCYLASKGFKNLTGIEINEDLYKVALQNKTNINNQTKIDINLKNINALEFKDVDQFNVFYLFNTFYDKDTYVDWLKIIERSLNKVKRKIKIIILFPTVSSMGAISEFKWLKQKERVIYKSQPCWRCVNFIIYEGEIC